MSQPDPRGCTSQLLSKALITHNHITIHAATSQAEEHARIEREFDGLRLEKKAAIERAANRYEKMMHANRRAERAEKALQREVVDRQSEKLRLLTRCCGYKMTIRSLEQTVVQAEQTGASSEGMQRLQADNAVLHAALAQQEAATVQVQPRAQKMTQGNVEAQKKRVEKEAEQFYEERLMEIKKQNEHLSHEFELEMSRLKDKLQFFRAENSRLVHQLEQAHKTVEWHKVQERQQSAWHGGSPRAACIHEGSPVHLQYSPTEVKKSPRKRTRCGSVASTAIGDTDSRSKLSSNAISPMHKRHRDYCSSTPNNTDAQYRYNDSSTLKEKHHFSQQLPIPTRQRTSTGQNQPLHMYADSLWPLDQPHSQAQLSQIRVQSTQCELESCDYLQQKNDERVKEGMLQVSVDEARPLWNEYMARMHTQDPSLRVAGLRDLHPMLQQYAAGNQSSSLEGEGGVRARCQTPSLSASTPIDQKVFATSKMQSPFPREVDKREQVQQQRFTDGRFLGSGTQAHHSKVHLLTSDCNTDMSGTLPIARARAPVRLSQMSQSLDIPFSSYKRPSELIEVDTHLFPGAVQHPQNEYQSTNQAHTDACGSLLSSFEGEYSKVANGTSFLGSFDHSDLVDSLAFSFDDFSGVDNICGIANSSETSINRISAAEVTSGNWVQQEALSDQQQFSADAVQFLDSEGQPIFSTMKINQTPNIDCPRLDRV